MTKTVNIVKAKTCTRLYEGFGNLRDKLKNNEISSAEVDTARSLFESIGSSVITIGPERKNIKDIALSVYNSVKGINDGVDEDELSEKALAKELRNLRNDLTGYREELSPHIIRKAEAAAEDSEPTTGLGLKLRSLSALGEIGEDGRVIDEDSAVDADENTEEAATGRHDDDDVDESLRQAETRIKKYDKFQAAVRAAAKKCAQSELGYGVVRAPILVQATVNFDKLQRADCRFDTEHFFSNYVVFENQLVVAIKRDRASIMAKIFKSAKETLEQRFNATLVDMLDGESFSSRTIGTDTVFYWLMPNSDYRKFSPITVHWTNFPWERRPTMPQRKSPSTVDREEKVRNLSDQRHGFAEALKKDATYQKYLSDIAELQEELEPIDEELEEIDRKVENIRGEVSLYTRRSSKDRDTGAPNAKLRLEAKKALEAAIKAQAEILEEQKAKKKERAVIAAKISEIKSEAKEYFALKRKNFAKK